MRDFDLLETSTFKAFWVASETLNFTEAAKKCAMTQSGISQHISRLEQQLGVPLFLRVNKKVLLTNAGKRFRSYVESYLDQVDSLKEELTDEHTALTGYVSYAMPESCLMSPHFGMLLERRKRDFSDLGLKVQICPSEEVIDKLIRDEVNFGFVTRHFDTPGVKLIPFCLEEYVLVSSEKRRISGLTLDSIKQMMFIGYPGSETIFEHWKKCHFPRGHSLRWSSLEIIGEMGSLKGVIEMVKQGMGVAVIPEHCVAAQIYKKDIFCDQAKSQKKARNQIYIATLEISHLPRRVEKVIETFMSIVS